MNRLDSIRFGRALSFRLGLSGVTPRLKFNSLVFGKKGNLGMPKLCPVQTGGDSANTDCPIYVANEWRYKILRIDLERSVALGTGYEVPVTTTQNTGLFEQGWVNLRADRGDLAVNFKIPEQLPAHVCGVAVFFYDTDQGDQAIVDDTSQWVPFTSQFDTITGTTFTSKPSSNLNPPGMHAYTLEKDVNVSIPTTNPSIIGAFVVEVVPCGWILGDCDVYSSCPDVNFDLLLGKAAIGIHEDFYDTYKLGDEASIIPGGNI